MQRARVRSAHVRPDAVTRARTAWREMAQETRTELRHMGVHGDLRQLDVAASGTRGKAAPKGFAAIATEMRNNGVPLAEATERLTHFAQTVAALVYAETTGAA
jgi:hypothetical protein